MIRRAFIGSIIIHAALAGGLLWAAGARLAPQSAPRPMLMVDLVAVSTGSAPQPSTHQPEPAVRPAAPPPVIEPAAPSELVDEVTDTDAAVVLAEAAADGEASGAWGVGAPEDTSLPLAARAPTSDDAWAAFYAAVRAAIERAKRYPPSARLMGQEDRVVLSFLIAPDGRAGDLQVVAPSKFPVLNRAAIETIQRVAAFPPPPADAESAGVRVRVPMVFALHNEGAAIR